MFDLQNAAARDATFIEEVWQKLDNKLSVIAERSREKIPYTTKDGVHDNRAESCIGQWTNGFWSGLMWLMYCGSNI